MAKPPYLGEDFMKDHKFSKDHCTHKAKNLSFFASIFSLFIYVCVFYIFNLSPYSLLNNNIFWFFMSNTLILIIAADYGAFSSSKQKQENLYEEYVRHSQGRNNFVPSYVSKYDDKQCIIINPKLQDRNILQGKTQLSGERISVNTLSPKIARTINVTNDQNSGHDNIPERVLEIVTREKCSDEKKPVLHDHLQEDNNCKEIEEIKANPSRISSLRSKSERFNRAKHVVINEKRVKRAETMKVETKKAEEENEFSKMSNEDLNRRVEEFIQKFNRQIRLQAIRNV